MCDGAGGVQHRAMCVVELGPGQGWWCTDCLQASEHGGSCGTSKPFPRLFGGDYDQVRLHLHDNVQIWTCTGLAALDIDTPRVYTGKAERTRVMPWAVNVYKEACMRRVSVIL